MLVILKRDNEEVNEQAAQFIAGAIRKKPSLTLGLATGNTMVGLYQHLARLHRAGSLDFSQVTTFNLDEYLGLPASHPQSFHRFMRENFFRHVNVPSRNIHIPDGGIRGDYDAYCATYEQAIRAPGEERPRCATTIVIGTIMDARKILLLATGASKAAAVAKSIEGPITCAVSASSLQLHPDVTFLLDGPAAAQLTQRDYYQRVLEMTALLTPDRLS